MRAVSESPPSDKAVTTPGFLRALVWGMVALSFADWVSSRHLLVATLNLGGSIPVWVEWLVWCTIACAPVFETIRRRRRSVVLVQSLCGIGLLGVAAIVFLSGSLSVAWSLLALVAAGGAFVQMVGWATFIEAVPGNRRGSRLFAAQFGMIAVPALWTAVFVRLSGTLHSQLSWAMAWAIAIAIWAVLCFAFAGIARVSLPEGLVEQAPASKDYIALYREVLASAFAKPGLLWVVAGQLAFALVNSYLLDLLVSLMLAPSSELSSALSNETLGSVTGLGAPLGLLVFPVIGRFGIERCWRPLVALFAIAPVLFATLVLQASMPYPFLVAVLVYKAAIGSAVGVAWTLYFMRYVAPGRFVLSHFAWLLGLAAAFGTGCRLLNSQIASHWGTTTVAVWILCGVPLFVIAGWKMPLGVTAPP